MEWDRYTFRALAIAAAFSAACTFQEPNLKTALPYPEQTVKLEIVNTAQMSEAEESALRGVLIQALQERNIRIHNPGEKTLTVEVVDFHREGNLRWTLKWMLECMIGGPWAHYTTNALNVKVTLRQEGSETRFTKFDEIEESARDFDKLERSIARRIASEVFMAKTHLR
ncbi:MAG: hypothetical protein A4C66_07280 [Nitrospira sp. HN-bin3]|uniref:hypothetical protein n=1 Tax=Nitrospira cf. moscoviensis SBR1015 TaxID=96242 RepID=UPI000A0A10C0|nr:hypothetical protein [Nitrospira cf. moscoviensis SBR1015]OQW45185.1 MAG: hypothetical protein A4C66_07280 [Nitrospira sp. HN-bin3]